MINTSPNYFALTADPDEVDVRVAAAALDGALNPQPINSSVVPICSTGNCTWPIYHSLAVCSNCANLSTQVRTTSDYQYVLPNGALLNPAQPSQFDDEYDTSGLVLNVTTTYDGLDTISFPNDGRVIADVFAISQTGLYEDLSAEGPIAFECILQFCVKTYNASVQDGVFYEQELDWLGETGPTTMVTFDDLPVTVGFGLDSFQNITVDGATFSVNTIDLYTVSNWFSTTFNGTVMSGRDSVFYYSSDTMNSIHQALTGQENQVYIMDKKDYVSDLNPIFKNMERTMTTMLRNGYLGERSNGTGLAVGTATRDETYLHVVWPWIILPALVQVLVLLFLALVILNTRRERVEVYKGSLLSVLFHGIDESSRQQMGVLDGQSELEAEAEDLEVEFVSRDGAGWRLLPTHSREKEKGDDSEDEEDQSNPL